MGFKIHTVYQWNINNMNKGAEYLNDRYSGITVKKKGHG